MQTRDEVERSRNCLEFSQPPRVFVSGYANTGKKFSSCLNIAFLEKYCYFVVYKQFICKR